MNWTPQQQKALAEIREWLKSDRQVFRLFGFAGTGKTTLTQEIESMVKGRVLYGAFTGKAASVMRRKGCQGAKTIHSLIYKVERSFEDAVEFGLDPDSEVWGAGLVVIDECSMVDRAIGEDLLSFGVKVLVIGDPAQLPPIQGAGYFTEGTPDFMLTEVHRQAAENPIIRLSMNIREGEPLQCGEYGASRVITRKQLEQSAVLSADQIIVGLNRTRELYNARIRELRGLPKGEPTDQDRLICLRNDKEKGLFNGGMWAVHSVKKSTTKRDLLDIVVDPCDEEGSAVSVGVLSHFFDGREKLIDWKQKKGTQEFTFGYAITCHKSQGSQWNDVMVFNESAAFREDAQRWLYTAVTRAAEKLTVVI